MKLICRLMFSVWAFKLALALPVAFHDYEDTGTKLRRWDPLLNIESFVRVEPRRNRGILALLQCDFFTAAIY